VSKKYVYFKGAKVTFFIYMRKW